MYVYILLPPPTVLKVRARISVQEKRNSVHKVGRDRIGSHDGRYVSHDSKHKPQLLSPLTRTRSPGISPKVSDSDISMASVVSVTSNRSTSQSHLRSVDEKGACVCERECVGVCQPYYL